MFYRQDESEAHPLHPSQSNSPPLWRERVQWPLEWADLATRGVSACSSSSLSRFRHDKSSTPWFEGGKQSCTHQFRCAKRARERQCGCASKRSVWPQLNDATTTVGHDHPMQIPAHPAFQRIWCLVLELLGVHLLPSGLIMPSVRGFTKIPEVCPTSSGRWLNNSS